MDYQFKIRKLYSLLFPTGRAWNYSRGSVGISPESQKYVDGISAKFVDSLGRTFISSISKFEGTEGAKFINAKLKAFDKLYSDILNVQNSILPDNENFDETDAFRWEMTLKLIQNHSELNERKERISRQLFYPNNVVERSHYTFIQEQLQKSGFDVYVHENRFWNGSNFEIKDPELISSQNMELGLAECGVSELNGEIQGTYYNSIIANSIDENVDKDFFTETSLGVSVLGEAELGDAEMSLIGQSLLYEVQLQASFFISGVSFPSIVDISLNRKEEFRQMVLKLKPLHTICYEYINYT